MAEWDFQNQDKDLFCHDQDSQVFRKPVHPNHHQSPGDTICATYFSWAIKDSVEGAKSGGPWMLWFSLIEVRSNQ